MPRRFAAIIAAVLKVAKALLCFASISLVAGLALGFIFLHPISRTITTSDLQRARAMGILESLDITPLSGWLIRHPEDHLPTVVLTHGRSSNRMQMFPLAESLFKRGFNVVLWDLPYHGNSGGRATYGQHEIRDLLRVVKTISRNPAVDASRVSLIGFSLGAAVTVGAAASSEQCSISAVVADSPYSSLRETAHWYVRLYGNIPAPVVWPAAAITVGFGSWLSKLDVDRLNPRDWAVNVRVPALIVQGAFDRQVKPDGGREIFERLPMVKEFWLVPNAGHTDSFQKNPGVYTERVAEFFLRHSRMECPAADIE
jgi:pimeloyl-ACP methyl ester carboxylesterase